MDWKNLIARISLEGLIPRVTLRYADSQWGPLVVISREVHERESGELREVSVAYSLGVTTRLAPWFEPGAAKYIHDLVAMNLGHEVSEHFCLDGRRAFDPHGGGRHT